MKNSVGWSIEIISPTARRTHVLNLNLTLGSDKD